MKLKLFAAAAAGAMALGAFAATADETAKAVDTKVLFENDRVRVVETTMPPGGVHDTHSHPDHVVYALSDGKVRFTGEDGKAIDAEAKQGEVLWVPAVTHKSENAGTADLRVVLVELKDPAK